MTIEFVRYGTELTDQDLMILGIVFGFRSTEEFEGFAQHEERKHQAKGQGRVVA